MTDDDLPASVNWIAKGAVTDVQNQLQCGDCYAFSACGAIEGITFIDTGVLTPLSEQMIVDCSSAEGTMGCTSGRMDQAFEYVVVNGGICSATAYPYVGADEACKSSSCEVVATISGYESVPSNSEAALMQAVARQPISVAVEADKVRSSVALYWCC